MFGLSVSHQGRRLFGKKKGLRANPRASARARAAPSAVSRAPTACEYFGLVRGSLLSECNCAAVRSLLHGLDLIRVLSDKAAHSRGLGYPHGPAQKSLK